MIRRILTGLAAAGIAAVAYLGPARGVRRRRYAGARAAARRLPLSPGDRCRPAVHRGWELSYPEAPPAAQVLTLQVGATEGDGCAGRLTAVAGAPARVARIAEVLGDPATPGADLAPAAALDLRLDLLGEHLPIDLGVPARR